METSSTPISFMALLMVMLLGFGFATGDVNQDKTECADKLVGLAPCLPYVGGTAKSPTVDCCSGLKQVLDKSRKCLCVLIKDKDDPSLGLKINATLAVTLPATCNAPVNMTNCVSLLHLAPNSQEAKMFEEYEKLTEGHATTPAAPGKSTSSNASTASEKSDGGKGKRRVGVGAEILALGFSLCVFILHQAFGM